MVIQSLQRLGLDQGADERAVKRAYARELKLIDQVQDAAGFQVLREAYETALFWLKHHAATTAEASVVPPPADATAAPLPLNLEKRNPDAADDAPPVTPLPDAYAAEDPRQLALEMFDQFQLLAKAVVAQGDNRDAAVWRKHLKRCTDDDRLINITARAYFEFHIAGLLASGWQPGHEALSVAAYQFFGWDKDRRRLMEFGQCGSVLNQAIDESEMFPHQSSEDCAGQSSAVLRVRESGEPSTRELLTHVPHLRTLRERFPAWTYVIADTRRITEWEALEQAVPSWRRWITGERQPSGESDGGGFKFWHLALVLLLLRMLFSAIPDSRPSAEQYPDRAPATFGQPLGQMSDREALEEEAYKRAAGRFYIPPGSRKLDPSLKDQSDPLPTVQRDSAAPRMAAPAGREFTDAEMNRIFASVDHRPVYPKAGRYVAEFEVTLDAKGAIKKMTKKRASGMPGLDPKIEQAIRAAAPFAADITRSFTLSYGLRYSDQPVPAQPNERKQDQSAPDPAPQPSGAASSAPSAEQPPEPAGQ